MLAHALEFWPTVTFKVGAANVVSCKAMANIGGVVMPGRNLMLPRGGEMIEHYVFAITRESFASGPLA